MTDAPDAPASLPDHCVHWGERDTELYDVWSPRGPARGVTVALVHGGFWRERYDRHHLRPLASALAGDGFTVASLEYPRVGMPGGGFPGTCEGVVAGLGRLLAASEEPVVAVGHSAGGHLVLWAGSEARLPGLAGVVSLAGVADLALADELGLGAGAVRDLLLGSPGHSPEGPLDAAAATLLPAADPARQRLTTPAVLLSGARDVDVPAGVAAAYLASRTPEDAPTRGEVLDADHFDLIDPAHQAYAALTRTLLALT